MSNWKNWPAEFGFALDLRDCVGKTIKLAEHLEGTDYKRGAGYVVLFTDGTRAWFWGYPSRKQMIVGPYPAAIRQSQIFTPEEIEQVDAWQRDEEQRAYSAEHKRKEREYRRLGIELGYERERLPG